MKWEVIWNFINQNIISEVIGALFFSFIVAYLFDKYSKNKETKELMNKILPLLEEEIEENQNSVEIVQKILTENKKNGTTTFIPGFQPFKTSIISTVFYGDLLKVMPIQRASLIIELFDYCTNANRIYKQLDQVLKEEFGKLMEPHTYRPDLTMRKAQYIEILEKQLLPSVTRVCDELRFQL